MRVSRIRYQPIEGGTLGGLFALHVTLGAGNGPEFFNLTPTELSTSIHSAFEKLNMACKTPNELVLFNCIEDGEIDTEEMLSLLGTLRDWGMKIVIWVGSEKRCAWFEFANYITVFLQSQHWPNFKVSEIRYSSPETLTEPELYSVNQSTALYVYNSGNALAFIKNAKEHRWGLILEPKSSIVIEFPISVTEKE